MTVESESQRVKRVIPIMNQISDTFCMAKWYHVTMYLQTGETHSCYHPRPHKIPLEELKNNPSALHNTEQKKLERKSMVEGGKPEGCQYCWNIENMGSEYMSDRHIRNASLYNEKRFDECNQSDNYTKNYNPDYIEINFGNECNFKCGYCHPKYSTSYFNEIKKFGPVTSVNNHRCDIDWMKLYSREDENPYVEAWWKWWPELKNDLQILRITGGEPTMHTSTWKILEDLVNDPMPNLELNINSNLGTKELIIEKLCYTVKNLVDNNKIKNFKLFTSLDTWGPRAEYIRTGLDLQLWEKNFHNYLSITSSPLTFMVTFNALTVTTFKSLLEKFLEWRKMYPGKENGSHRIRFDTPYLKEPLQYDMNILTKQEFMPYMWDALEFMKSNLDDTANDKFTTVEYEKFKRVVDYMNTTVYSDEKLKEGRKDFYNWFTELDKRRNTNFIEVFPEMKKFYNLCRNQYAL